MKKEERKSTESEILKSLEDFDKNRDTGTVHGELKVRISDDKLKAYINVPPPVNSADNVDKAAVVAALNKAGVKFGIDEKAIDELFTYGSFNVDVPVAMGRPPSDGVSARIEYKFDTTGDKSSKPVEDEHGNVDHRDLNIVTSVEEGALLAVKTPAKLGEKGMNVVGEELPAKEGKDVNLPAGENTKVGEDGFSVYAAAAGQPIIKDNKICVSPVFEVRGDVNYRTGNIKFKGSVVIRGNIASDFVVEATDDVDIHGNIEKASIIAGGDARIMGGIYGAGTGKISAGGSVTIRTVESAIVEAGQNITITQMSRYSTLRAGEDIILSNAKGSIIGGKASAGHHFIVSNLGATSFTETIIEIGINPKIKEAYDELEKRIADHKVQLDKAIRSIKTIRDMEAQGHALTPDKVELMKKLVPAVHQIQASLENDQAKLDFLRDKLKSLQSGRARVNYKTYPGVKLFSLNSTMNVQREINHSTFYEQNEQIIVGPY